MVYLKVCKHTKRKRAFCYTFDGFKDSFNEMFIDSYHWKCQISINIDLMII